MCLEIPRLVVARPEEDRPATGICSILVLRRKSGPGQIHFHCRDVGRICHVVELRSERLHSVLPDRGPASTQENAILDPARVADGSSGKGSEDVAQESWIAAPYLRAFKACIRCGHGSSNSPDVDLH